MECKPRTQQILQPNIVRSFNFECDKDYTGVYTIDDYVLCVGKKVWRSADGKYIMFWNGIYWILTHTAFEKQIGPKCGGLISSRSDVPYTNKWNTPNVMISYL
jgi:hypothetical protein